MDYFDSVIVNLLQDGRPKTFDQIMEGAGFARSTVTSHLRHLIDDGIVLKEKVVARRRGRPRFNYRLPKALARPSSSYMPADIVTLTFQKLKHACRFEKGGRCREVRKQCTPEACPLTIRK